MNSGLRRATRSCMVLLLVGLVTALSPPAVAAGAGSISGTVTTAGTSLAGADVTAWHAATGEWGGAATTDVHGTYRIPDLAAGSYRLEFRSDDHVVEYYDDQAHYWGATDIVVGAGPVEGKDADLAPGARVTGTVTDGSGPVAGAQVAALQHVEEQDSSWWDSVGWATTGDDGTYSLGGLPSGTYVLEFRGDGHARQYWQGKDNLGVADTFELTAGEQSTSSYDAQLRDEGRITGTVENAAGAPVPGVWVSVIAPVGTDDWIYVDSAASDDTGAYSLGGLAGGQYWVEFEPPEELGYLTEYWNNRTRMVDADPVVVVEGSEKTGIDAVLGGSASIRGKVTGPDGNPVQGVHVGALVRTGSPEDGWWWDQVRSATTDELGKYRIGGLNPRTYKVEFQHVDHITEYWNNKDGVVTGDPVTLLAGDSRTGINAQLAAGARITGVVTGGGSPLAEVGVTAYRKVSTADGADWVDISYGYSGPDGSYVVGSLPSGKYKLHYWADGYAEEFYRDAPNMWTADTITVAAPGAAAVDPVELTLGASVTGRVTDYWGTPLADVEVSAYALGDPADPGSGDWYTSTSTDADGEYVLERLRPGDYVIQLWAGGYAEAYWDDELTFEEATPVSVLAGEVVPDVDVTMLKRLRNSSDPSLSGQAVVGSTARVSMGTFNQVPDNVVYEWWAGTVEDGEEQIDADGLVYTLTPAEVGKEFWVIVRATKEGYAPYEAGASLPGLVRKRTVAATLSGTNAPGIDRLKVVTGQPLAAGVAVTLLRLTPNGTAQVDADILNSNGAFTFEVPDAKPRASTTYFAKVAAGPGTLADRSNQFALN